MNALDLFFTLVPWCCHDFNTVLTPESHNTTHCSCDSVVLYDENITITFCIINHNNIPIYGQCGM